jgi:ankyrin repeat protein
MIRNVAKHFYMHALAASMVLGVAAPQARAAKYDREREAALFSVIRNADLAAAKKLFEIGVNPNSTDADGSSALMYAALYANADFVRLLLDKGATPNVTNAAGATALMWGVRDLEITRMLVSAGANVNARSATGRTPLLIASSIDGASETAKLLLDKGADINAKDKLTGFPNVPVGAGGATVLMEAARCRDARTIKLLIARGADINGTDNSGATALLVAAINGNTEAVRLLLANGAEANMANKAGTTALTMAAIRGDEEIAKMLLSRGAKVDSKDMGGMTALMWAAYSERGNPSLVRALLAAGADVNVKNKAGETPLDWALRNGNTPIVEALAKAGATGGTTAASVQNNRQNIGDVRAAVETALAGLQKSGPEFSKKSGCVSCHHQSLPALAVRMAKDRNLHYDSQISDQQLKAAIGMWKPFAEPLLLGTDVIPDLPVTGSYNLIHLAAENYPADKLTDAIVLNIASKQQMDGSWIGWSPRPPIEYGDLRATAIAIRGLQLYAPEGRKVEFQRRVEKAAKWLASMHPATEEERSMQLLGLNWAKAPRPEIERAGKLLVAKQRPDGGWAQLATLDSDAYATGEALVALYESGILKPGSPEYRRGVEYLLRTQYEDGSWMVKTRVFPFQKLVDTGFPHGRDQWISAAGTTWAAMALMYAEPAGLQARK